MTCECGFIQLSSATYINNEMEWLVSLLGRYEDQLYSSYYQQSSSNLIKQAKSSSFKRKTANGTHFIGAYLYLK